MLGSKTLLVEQSVAMHRNATSNIGGDCTNGACVPSKALQSVARRMALWNPNHDSLPAAFARIHATETILSVRKREDPRSMVERNSNLEIAIVSACEFISPYELSLTIEESFPSHNKTTMSPSRRTIRSTHFLIATGASPRSIPLQFQTSGQRVYTYQSLLRPSENELALDSIWSMDKSKRIVIVGGGATACELGQSLARIVGCDIELVAPTLLRGDDATLANAAAKLLIDSGIQLHLGLLVQEVLKDRSILLSNGSILSPCDALVVCTGRSPASSLERLKLHKAKIEWNDTLGVLVHRNLQSISAPHVYACGDCCSAVQPLSRSATQAAWTGYYAAAQTRLPRLLTLGAKIVPTIVPRVIYTDPELVSVGLSYEDCVAKYGVEGFDRLNVPTSGTDRSDMDRLSAERRDIGFVELRASQVDGRLLGITACGPVASELANEMSVILEHKLTTMDVARCLHSYPSYGYMLHRVALAMALSNLWGSLEASGTLGTCLAWMGRKVSKCHRWVLQLRLSSTQKAWQAEGASQRVCRTHNNDVTIRSFLDLYTTSEETMENLTRSQLWADGYQPQDVESFLVWLSQRQGQSQKT